MGWVHDVTVRSDTKADQNPLTPRTIRLCVGPLPGGEGNGSYGHATLGNAKKETQKKSEENSMRALQCSASNLEAYGLALFCHRLRGIYWEQSCHTAVGRRTCCGWV